MFEDIKNNIISFGEIAGNRNLTPGFQEYFCPL